MPIDDRTRFETLFEIAPFSIQLLAADGRTLRVNRAWESLWQVDDPGVIDYLLGEYNILNDPQLEAKGVTAVLRRAFDGESVTLPPVFYDPAETGLPGRSRWLRAQAHPIRDADGAVHEVMLVHEDVTERIQAQTEAALNEMRLKQLANTIPQLAWMAEPDGHIHWFNDRWYAYTGTTPDEMQGWGWQRVHDPAVLPQVVAAWRESIASGSPLQMSFPLRGRDGVFRPFFTLVAPLKDASGRVLQWFGTNTDVSALHDAQRGLAAAEERLRLATLAGGIGIWDWDIGTDRITWSDEVYALYGIDPGSFGGTLADVVLLFHPDDREAMGRRIEAALGDGQPFSAEFRVVLAGGETKWLSTWARVRHDGEGRPLRMVGALISIDSHKRAEAALRDADRRKDEFLAMLAHELRNPLAPISTAASLLQTGRADGEQVLRASSMISRQVRHMTELVDDLLDVSRVTRGLIDLEMAATDVKSVVSSAIEQARPVIEARSHELRTVACAEPVAVRGDSTRLTQVVVNLLTNAAKYTPDGGGITLRVDARGAAVEITVTDNGVGIDAALLPHVFELFTQGARGRGRSEGGLGIGLALVRTIVDLHGGEVGVTSAGAGAGSTFTITLPRLAVAETPVVERERIAATGGGPRVRVMVVDDNRDAALAMQMLLDADGHDVVVAHDARSALQLADTATPEIFVLDIGLPDIDGYELARLLRDKVAGARFVALTGYGQPEDLLLSQAAGFDRHLVKPVDADVIGRVLQELAR